MQRLYIYLTLAKYLAVVNIANALQETDHTDHLGSSSVITDNAGNRVQETYYFPFGGTRLNTGNVVKHKYTGQEEDSETGLYFYNARYYDPMLGRFISADSIVSNPRDPQDLNRYTYAGNNPLIYTDPSGHLKFKSLWKAVVSGIVGGAVFVLSGGTASPILAGMLAGASAGATSAALNEGNLNQILKSAAIGGIIGGITGGLYQGLGTPATEALRNGVMYGMLAAGAVYVTAKDGLNGLAYYGAGVLGGIAGASAAEYAMENWGSSQTTEGTSSNNAQIGTESQKTTFDIKIEFDIKVDYSNKQTYLEWVRENTVLSAENIAPVQSGTELSMLDFTPTPLKVGGSVGKGAIKYLFGKGGLLNSNRYLRIGFSRFGGDRVFRISGDWIKLLPESWHDEGHIILKNLGPLKKQ
jgi:RHS repeat-associated protein